MRNAAVFRITSDLINQATNMIVGIERHSPNLINTYVCYVDKTTDSLLDLKKICESFNKKFIAKEYDDSQIKSIARHANEKHFFERYPSIVFSLFEIFNLLNDFELVLAFDVDMIVIDNIDDLIKYNKGVSFRKSRRLRDIFKNSTIQDEYSPNAGLIIVSRNIVDYSTCTQKCYEILKDNINNMNGGLEEGTIRLLIDKYNIAYEYIPTEYNCPIGSVYASMAKIIHYMKIAKPWQSIEVEDLIFEYTYNKLKSRQILNKNHVVDPASLQQKIARIKYKKINDLLYSYLINNGLSAKLYPSLNIDWPYLKFKIKGGSSAVHLDVRYKKKTSSSVSYEYITETKFRKDLDWELILSIDSTQKWRYEFVKEYLCQFGYRDIDNKFIKLKKEIDFELINDELSELTDFVLSRSEFMCIDNVTKA